MRASLKPLGEMIAIAVLAAGAALAAPAQAQDQGQGQGQGQGQQAAAPRVPPSQSVEQANATLVQVEKGRAAVNGEYAASERICYTKFFVNRCLDQAKEKRRAALSNLRAMEVEAQHFKRADAVEKRDAELAVRARKDADEQSMRAVQPLKPAKVADETVRAAPGGPSVEEREAQHAARVKRQDAQDAADVGKRAANVAAFEQKKVESEKRKAEVARKTTESAQKRAAKEASEQKKAAAAAASASASASK